MPPTRWRIRLGREAENDFSRILAWTRERFGEHQFGVYKITLVQALAALEDGPEIPGSCARDEILPGLRILHVARKGRGGRHFILYRAGEGQLVEIIRFLHDAMDVNRKVGREDG